MVMLNFAGFLYLILSVLGLNVALQLFTQVSAGCVFLNGKYDLSVLDWSPWQVVLPKNGTDVLFEISLCRPLNYSISPQKEKCTNSSVCRITNGTATNMASYTFETNVYNAFEHAQNSGFSLYLVSGSCNGQIGSTSSVVISFLCGPDLGSPELLMENECNVYFTWKTSAVCKNAPIRKEVPCYVYDKEGRKRNLAPLIKQKGGYNVISPNVDIDFVINVCSDIYLDNDTQSCPNKSSACRNLKGQYVSFGMPDSKLQFVENGLLLTYKTTNENSLPQGCDLPPKTTILFRCPPRRNNMIPRLISDTNCQYEVEWETEYACPDDILKGDLKKCQFTKNAHGVEIDLSPLRKDNGVYHVVGSVNGTSTDFSFNVCGGLNMKSSCGGKTWASAAVCANYSEQNRSEIVGTTHESALKYVDGNVILSYGRGAECSNGLSQTTVINFYCNKSAEDDGHGRPKHLETKDCVNHFEWGTKYVCLRHQLETVCSARKGTKIINLQNLMKSEDELPWVAIDRRYMKDKNQNATYFINICGEVPHFEEISCKVGTSVCMKDHNGNYLSLGMFTFSPFYDSATDHVKLEYTGGNLCRDQQAWKSTITFICKPGHVNTAPALVEINSNDCEYQFEWHTAEACPEGFIHGNECRITDSNLGLNFDLTPLKEKVYEVNTDIYKFYLSVCGPVKNSLCGKDYASRNIGACQVTDGSNPSIWKIGEPSSEISYSDGIVKLTYLHGDPYNNANKTLRLTTIIFICDIQAGKGEPHFVEEANYAYVFHWFTDLVCQHSISTECVVIDPVTLQQYDLSRLARSRQNWVVLDTEDEGEKKFYINVCRPLVSSTSCDPLAASCLVNDKNNKELHSVINLGQALTAPQIVSEGHLQLNYTHGDPCRAYDQQLNYSTIIHFACSKSADDENEGPRFLNKVGECQYMFLWTTEAACPSDDVIVKNECQLTDPDTGFVFDLTYLQKKDFYTVSTESHTFQVNICGAVRNGCQNIVKPSTVKNISVCEINNHVGIGSADSYILRYTGEELSLIYKAIEAASNEKSVIISFPCDNTTGEMNLRFIKEDLNSYFFEMKTALTCQSEQYDCTFTDSKGNEYDLNPLSRSSSVNWEVVDVRETHSDLRYHINFCRPLNKVSNYKCPGGAVAACQTSMNNHLGEGKSLGSLTGAPEVSEDGLITVLYTGGSFCHNGQFKRSARVNLFCSPHQGELVFVGETPECEYIFYFDTPAACPLHTNHGTNCMVKDPVFGYVFDLKPLQRTENYIINAGEYKYVLNVCGPLNGLSNLCTNSSVCQTKSADQSFAKSLGKPSTDLVYRQGILELKYASGSENCHRNYTRSTIITFSCDHSTAENEKGPSFVSEEEDCTYLFEWPTSYACPPFTVTECVAEDNEGQQYDLSGLSLTNDNYFVKNPNIKNQTFVINVCRSVVHTPDSICPYKAASCLIDSSGKRQENLGEVTGRPYFENNKLKIKYTLGDKCMFNGRNSGQFMETIIMFECDKHKIDSEPEFIGQDSCTYHFIWYTSYACPLKAPEITSDCTAENSLTGVKYDLSALRKDIPYVIQKGTHKFSLNVCGNMKDSSCGPQSGACQQETTGSKRHWNAGNSNSELHFHDGILFLNYSGGDYCHQKRFQRNTIISFHCGKDLGEPTFLYESDDCTYYFNWVTELACESLVHCAINNGSYHYDLLPLATVSGYHTAVSNLPGDNATYYISVCHPLNPMPNSCPSGSSICLVSNDGSGSQNLGRVEYPPFVDFEGHATAIYTNGSICPTHPDERNKARIIFICEPDALLGTPVLIAKFEDICYYIFEWRTSIVCTEKITPLPQECSFADSRMGVFDLAPLHKIGSNYEIKDDKEGLILLNVCGPVNSSNLGCSKASVCFNDSTTIKNYGTFASQTFSYDGVRLRLTVTDGDDCPSSDTGKSTSEILFSCNMNAGLGKPTLFKKFICTAVFLWETNLVCENVKHQCSFDIGGKYFDFHLLSSLSHNWNVTDGKGNVYWLNMCQGLQHSTDIIGCPPSAAVCRKDKNGHFASLGIIHTMEVKQTDSGGIMLKYASGSSEPCSEAGSTKGIRASTTIHFMCGNSRGAPELLSDPNGSCIFDFKWETSLACSEKMEEVLLDENGVIYDKRLNSGLNITEILNRTFTVHGHSGSDEYIYIINLGQGTKNLTTDTCSLAAVCQTKSTKTFYRDIGSYDSKKFYIRGSELHLVLTSHGRPCGKNKNKNVTTIINMQCSSFAGVGSPEFLYETSNCDYIFHWETKAVCPDFSRFDPVNENSKHTTTDIQKEYQKSSSHTTELVLGFILSAVVVFTIIFIISKEERRTAVSSRFRSIFNKVRLPQFRYKRDEGETLILIDGNNVCSQYDDGNDVDLLT